MQAPWGLFRLALTVFRRQPACLREASRYYCFAIAIRRRYYFAKMAQRILVIRLSSLGDVLLTSAPVLNLKLAFPDSAVTFFTKEQFRPLVELFDGVDEIRTLDATSASPSLYSTALDLDRERFDLVVDLHRNLRSWFTRTMVSSPRSAVYSKHREERLQIVRTKRFPDPPLHTIDSYNDCLSALGLATPSRRPILRATPSNLAESARPYMVIAPGAAHANKQWPIERFAEVALRLHQERSLGIIWAVTSGDRGKSSLEKLIAPGRFIELVDEPLESLGGILSGARITISNDSGLMHLSSAVGTPVLGIFGPTHPALGFSPRGIWDRIVEVDEFCRPCSLHGKTPCYRSERFCFTRITAAMVTTAAAEMLDQADSRTPALFLDRDGTVMVDKDYLSDPEQIELIPGAVEALKSARQLGYKLVILSNQSGVARGIFSLAGVERVNARLRQILRDQGVEVDGIFYCPHYPGGSVAEFAVSCDCRKPAPLMAERAARELGIDLQRSIVIGDKEDDLNLARVLGVSGILVRTGHGTKTEQNLKENRRSRIPVADSLLQAVDHLRQGAPK